MTIKSEIEKDYLTSFKARDEFSVSVLRLLKSAIKNQEISAKTELDDDEIIKVLKKEFKQRQDSISQYEAAGRDDLASTEKRESELISKYLPAQIDLETVKTAVTSAIAELKATSSSDFGKVMGFVMKKLGNNADGKQVTSVIKDILDQK